MDFNCLGTGVITRKIKVFEEDQVEIFRLVFFIIGEEVKILVSVDWRERTIKVKEWIRG